MHDLDHGQAGLLVQRAGRQLPGAFKLGAHGRVGDVLVVGQHHGDQTRVRGALHVVLATQRVQAGTRAADLAGHQRQRDQAARVVGAVHVLRHTHAPEDHRAFGGGVQAGHIAQCVGVNAADRCHQLGRVAFNVLAQLFVADGAAGNESFVDQTLGHDDVHHRVEHGHVGVGLELQVPVRHAREVRAARVQHQQLAAVFHSVLDPGGGHRVVDRRVGTNDDNHLGLGDVHHRVGHRPRADAFEQRHH